MVSGSGRGEEQRRRRRRCETHPGEISRKEEDRAGRCRGPSTGGRTARRGGGHRAGSRERTEGRARGRSSGREEPDAGQARTARDDEPQGPQGRETGRTRQTEKRKRRNTHYFLPRTPPLSVLHAGGEYLGVVANIITQADEAGFELLGTQRAGVILGPPCVRQRAMRCQGGEAVRGGVGHAPGEGGK